jgi:hypothetical protein
MASLEISWMHCEPFQDVAEDVSITQGFVLISEDNSYEFRLGSE